MPRSAPSTHPVAGGEALDTQAALQDFDGISYAKGAATLRQLIAHIGDEAFIAGVGAYLREHAFGNGTLADFLGFMERASGKDLSGWSRSWLLTAGLDVIAADQKTGVVTREVPQDYPAARPHTLDVAGFSGAEEVFRVAVTLDGDATDSPSLAAAPAARIVVPNASDLTWATVALDADTLAAVPAGLAQVPDPQARAVVWAALVDGVCLGTVDPRLVVDTLGMAWPLESNESVLNRIAVAVLGRIIPSFLPPDEQAGAKAVVAEAARALLARSAPGSTTAVLAARTLARSSADESLLWHWAGRQQLPPGLQEDSDFRWLVVRNLAGRGLVDADFIEQVRREDDTLAGRLGALSARASLPAADAKAWAWRELTTNRSRSNYELNALAAGFWSEGDLDVLRSYVPRYFAEPAAAVGVGRSRRPRAGGRAGLPGQGRRAAHRGRERSRAGSRRSEPGGSPLHRRRGPGAAGGAALAGVFDAWPRRSLLTEGPCRCPPLAWGDGHRRALPLRPRPPRGGPRCRALLREHGHMSTSSTSTPDAPSTTTRPPRPMPTPRVPRAHATSTGRDGRA